jgi:DNA-binding transcriptional regulator WhiA
MTTTGPKRHFAGANQRRTEQAATQAVTAVKAALQTFLNAGVDPGAHLTRVGLHRLAHPHASLADLAATCDPPMTKDAYAGQLRRLIARATRVAAAVAAEREFGSPIEIRRYGR